MFNYTAATDNEILEHVRTSSSATVSVSKAYHESKGNFEIVAKINKARSLLKQARMMAQLSLMSEDTAEFGRYD
jgi:hypothetical protein